ncbi:MAG: alpha/beta hydrolase [Limibacillus sp.]
MDITLDGLRLHASTGGQTFDPEKPAIVFLHGAGMDHTVWALQSRYFAHRGYGVLALDLPGHGRSEGTALATIEDWADWTARFIEAAGLKQAALVGHSMGSLIALATAAQHPERVRALALLGVAARMPVHPDLLEAAENNDRKAAELISSWGFGPTGHIGGTRLPGLYLLWGGERLLEKAKPGSLFADRVVGSHQIIQVRANRLFPSIPKKRFGHRVPGAHICIQITRYHGEGTVDKERFKVILLATEFLFD